MRITVTGGAGHIGRYAVDHLVRSGNEVVSIDQNVSASQSKHLRPATQELVGDAADFTAMSAALEGADAVLHLAAVPSPIGRSVRELIKTNSYTTMNVLEAAAINGVKAAVVASSTSIYGFAWSEEMMAPIYVPVDESHPLRPTEGYALSKECDEACGRTAARRWGMRVAALRFPYTNEWDEIERRRHDALWDVVVGTQCAKELWAYLDIRDAAMACESAILATANGRIAGFEAMNVVADDVLVDGTLNSLFNDWYPGARDKYNEKAPRCAYSSQSARELINFSATHMIHPR